MAQQLYKNYMRLLEKWPIDPSKKGRDLGEFIRQQVAKEFSHGEASTFADLKDCEKKLESLNRLASNVYGNQYKRSKTITVSGLTLEECREILSTENLQRINETKLSFRDKVSLFFARI